MIHATDRGPDGAVRLLTIDRQERRNAVNHDALEELRDALAATTAAVDGGSTRVLVLTGAGGHFCAGADLSGVEDAGFVALLNEVLDAIRTAPFPTIAAVEGAALGAGTQLATACDLRVAAPDATFGIPAGKLGLMVDQWTVHRLAGLAGQGTARQLLLAADTISGERAYTVGLVSHLGDLAEALSWAERIAALAPLTLAGHKLGLNETESIPPTSPAYGEAFARAWGSDDLQEGLAAFRERRSPSFHGR